MKKEEVTAYKKLSEEYEEQLFFNYHLTDLMILSNGNRRVKSNENYALTILLRQKLEQYGLSLFGSVERDGLIFRGVRLLDGFPIENEPILKQLYGYVDFTAHVQLRGFDSFATAFDYNVDTGACELQRHSWGSVTDRIPFETLKEMLAHLEEHGHENAFNKCEL